MSVEDEKEPSAPPVYHLSETDQPWYLMPCCNQAERDKISAFISQVLENENEVGDIDCEISYNSVSIRIKKSKVEDNYTKYKNGVSKVVSIASATFSTTKKICSYIIGYKLISKLF